MKTQSRLFNASDVGCWINGAYGAAHRRAVLVDLMQKLGNEELATSLHYEPPDDFFDEDDALALLQAHTAPGLVWILEAGDLILTTEEEAS